MAVGDSVRIILSFFLFVECYYFDNNVDGRCYVKELSSEINLKSCEPTNRCLCRFADDKYPNIMTSHFILYSKTTSVVTDTCLMSSTSRHTAIHERAVGELWPHRAAASLPLSIHLGLHRQSWKHRQEWVMGDDDDDDDDYMSSSSRSSNAKANRKGREERIE